MTQRVLLLGSSGGIGSSLLRELSARHYDVTGWDSDDLDLDRPQDIFLKDFSRYDMLANCTGHSQGTFRGFLGNSWQNQLSQIMVNYVSNLFLLKHYALSRSSGRYIWISSIALDRASVYQSVYGSTKAGSKFAIDLIRQECDHVNILEVKLGLVKTNTRYRNFEGTMTAAEVDKTYDQSVLLQSAEVATRIADAIDQNKNFIEIV